MSPCSGKEVSKRKINENHELVDEFNPVHRAKYRDWIEKNRKEKQLRGLWALRASV